MAVAQALMRGLADRPTLRVLCREAGSSVRTVERIFRGEVGTDFEAWRRQARLMRGIELLAGGSSVKEAAFATGYRQPSAFVAMFRQTMGATPRAWRKSIAGVTC